SESLLPAAVQGARSNKLHVGGNLPPKIPLRTAVSSGINALDHLDGILLASTRDESDVRRAIQLEEERPLWMRALWKLGLSKSIGDPRLYVLSHWSDKSASALFSTLAEHHVYQIATLRLYGTLLGSSDSLVRLPPAPLELRRPPRPSRGWSIEPYSADHPSSRTYDKMLWSVAEMNRKGVPILTASDTPNLFAAPGSSLHDELGLLVRAGLTPLDAIRSATLRPAEFQNATDSLGTVAAGKVADFIVLDDDPTVNIANTRRISLVVSRGRAFDRRALDAMREAGTAMAREIEAYWIAREGKAK
ncbi:MAG: amidohydrolase family protein, partial [Gemmatimonadaceae bacterium]